MLNKVNKNNQRNTLYNRLVDWYSKNPSRYIFLQTVLNWGLPYDYVAKIIKSQNNDRILELGCGPALILDHIKYKNYVGIDSNKASIEYASNKYGNDINTNFINANILEFDYSAHDKFDKILMLGLMHHLSDLDLKKLLSLIPNLLNTDNENSSVVTFDIVRTKYHFISNKLCDLDQGKFVRHSDEYLKLLNEYFFIIQSTIITSRSHAVVYIVNETKCK